MKLKRPSFDVIVVDMWLDNYHISTYQVLEVKTQAYVLDNNGEKWVTDSFDKALIYARKLELDKIFEENVLNND